MDALLVVVVEVWRGESVWCPVGYEDEDGSGSLSEGGLVEGGEGLHDEGACEELTLRGLGSGISLVREERGRDEEVNLKVDRGGDRLRWCEERDGVGDRGVREYL